MYMEDFEQKKKPKVGILTTFYNFDSSYSLCTVVKQQLEVLVKHGYETVLFVLTSFNDMDKVPQGVEVRVVVPQLVLEPYGSGDISNLKKDVEVAQKAFEEHMQDIDVMLTHDIIFINSFLPYNQALRDSIETKLGHIKWLHWMHSGPSIRPNLDGSPFDNLYTLPKNSRLVYMNYTDAIRAAEMYGVWESDVRTIFNPMDIRSLYNVDELTKGLVERYDLLSADVICTYPLSTTRMGAMGKQLDKVIWIMSEIKKLHKSIRLVVCNAHANGEREKQAIERMYEFARSKGMEDRELIFTSLYNKPKWELGVPHKVVQDLFLIGNLFIFPSVSENCPLVLLEAMAAKNVLVLNRSFPAMKDFALENALYFHFGSLVDEPRFPNGIENYMQDIAKIVINELRRNKALQAQDIVRKKFNMDTIFTQQLEPAILELYYGY